ncbi:MAG: transporter permease [Microbacteriaceae bacterium]|nr:transporter permease [Microbacteriaceae bacterium]
MIRSHGSSLLVAALSAAFGTALLATTGVLSQIIAADDVTGSSATVVVLLGVLAFVFMAISIYVGAVVTSNTFSTIIAGRTRTIALYRLLGASASDQRKSVAREGLMVGIGGAVSGTVVGTVLVYALVSIGQASGFIPRGEYSIVEPVLVLPVIAVVLTTWLASWIGSRSVLAVSPIEGAGVAVGRSSREAAGKRGRNATAAVFFFTGFGILAIGVLMGLVSPMGILVAVLGGIFSFTGVVLGAALVMPVALRLVGRLFGVSATAKLAAQNAVRYPERSARNTIGLVIGVTLVTMFAVAVECFQVFIHSAQASQPEVYEGTGEVLTVVVAVFSVLMGFSAVIAAVGMVNNLSMSVLQRTKELGLLRALGFTTAQVRRMIVTESAQLTIAAVGVGLVLGITYGWAGAQSLLGSINGGPGLAVPAVPLTLLGMLVVASALLVVIASIAPSRRATRVTPIAALAAE